MLRRRHFETETFLFQNDAEQSKLTALNNNSKNALKTRNFFFCTEREKRAKVLRVRWPCTSGMACFLVPEYLLQNFPHGVILLIRS